VSCRCVCGSAVCGSGSSAVVCGSGSSAVVRGSIIICCAVSVLAVLCC